MRILRILALVSATAAVSFGAVVSFDFESTVGGTYAGSLIETNNGLMLTVTPDGYPGGSVLVREGSIPAELGNKAIAGNQELAAQFGAFAPLRFTFSQPVSSITFAFGDLGADESDSPVTIDAYDSGNTLLGSLTETYPGGFDAAKTLSGSFPNALYFVASSGTNFGNPNSLVWEVQSVTFAQSEVPEPSTITVLGGLVVLFACQLRPKARD